MSFKTNKYNNFKSRACLAPKYNKFRETLFLPQIYYAEFMENYHCYFLHPVINQNAVRKTTCNTYQHHPLPSLFEYKQDTFFSKT